MTEKVVQAQVARETISPLLHTKYLIYFASKFSSFSSVIFLIPPCISLVRNEVFLAHVESTSAGCVYF